MSGVFRDVEVADIWTAAWHGLRMLQTFLGQTVSLYL